MASTTMDTGDISHLRFYPRCGICADTILRHERVIALFGNRDSTSYCGYTRPFPFPQSTLTITTVAGRLACRFPDCETCAASPEFVQIHFDCFEIFKQRCSVSASDALSRLWILAAWRDPWRGSPPIHLSAPMDDIRFCGLPLLCTLPLELLEMIRHYSRYSLLWRCIPVLQLAAYVSATDPEPLLTVPLRELLFWERGGQFERVTGSRSPLPTLRLTVDSAGISKVERLPGLPLYAGECSSRSAFILRDEASISEVVAQLKDGRLRLDVPARLGQLPIWNTPAPPSLTFCKVYPAERACQAFYAVEMDEIKGITFFFSFDDLCGIHIHRSEESCAMDTFARIFQQPFRRAVVWIYLPISKCDRVLVLGMREAVQAPHNRSILVRMERVGDIIIACRGDVKEVKDWLPPRRLPFAKPGPSPIEDHAYFSWAPLGGVASTLVFYDQRTGSCRGIVFHYQNGGSRAVGECRLHVDPAESVVRPARLCFRADSCPSRYHSTRNRMIDMVQVKFEQGAAPTNDAETDIDGWKSRPMKGLVKFWFYI
ncbi:hypothetical protein QBC46DRAFT_430920 [Diplogelasinospora grovesii]|uniref:Uncharacterized protein n=1 Tax=Diplogelasinospora grovesii TaxID=303347 RepID=A0AAN6N995_9PEZI|nr:hypothetical protein QBC46DRAFT_430920 [Diplogelasinospora grovesii]